VGDACRMYDLGKGVRARSKSIGDRHAVQRRVANRVQEVRGKLGRHFGDDRISGGDDPREVARPGANKYPQNCFDFTWPGELVPRGDEQKRFHDPEQFPEFTSQRP